MSQFANAMAVFKLLEKSSCRKCNDPTCLSFAAKVFIGHRHRPNVRKVRHYPRGKGRLTKIMETANEGY
ncbi:MAG: hypothetical protein KKF12_18830 [Proteobacteria bacterium]|nr:hypothetical protein [Pseudomonadota bacterium]MBU4132878.1 hypothetical protein [Pseudomonadota bacterium]